MSPTAAAPELLKQASKWNAFKSMMRHGVWKHLDDNKVGPEWLRTTGKYLSPNQGWKGHGLVGKGLLAYGGAGAVGDVTDKYHLPGSTLAFNLAYPVVGSMFTGASAITAARMASRKNQERLQEDVMGGAREGAADFLQMTRALPQLARNPNLYAQFSEELGSGFDQNPFLNPELRKAPASGYKRFSRWFENPQANIDDEIDRGIFERLSKSGSQQASLAKLAGIGAGIGKALPWVFGTMGVGTVAHSALRDKPYDEISARQKGYQGAQAGIQQRLGNLSFMERMALRLDPTLIGDALEDKIPGTMDAYRGATGMDFKPGWLAGIRNSFRRGGTPSYYTYDLDGKRHYA
jgi:hypothetical protein